MTSSSSSSVSLRRRAFLARHVAVACGVSAFLTLAACGGGGSEAAPDAQQAWTTGPITGLGSIIVNGVRYDDSAAQIESDDGAAASAASLKVGMMVEVKSSTPDDSTGRARASHVRFGSELVGPISAVDATAQTVTVLGQTVEITSSTAFDDSLGTGFAALTVGRVVEIHALYNATTQRYVATRIEDKSSVAAFKVRGLVRNLDTQAKTFSIGTLVISYANIPAAGVPTSLANGMHVHVLVATTQVNGQWVATALRMAFKRMDDFRDARLRGLVSDFTSPQAFSINGVPIDASSARFEPSASAVVLGAYVKVQGQAVNGVVVASKVEVKRPDESSWNEVELHGAMSSLNTSAKTFVVRGVTVDYSAVAEWRDGAAAGLADGRQLEVKGFWSSDRTRLMATRVKFES